MKQNYGTKGTKHVRFNNIMYNMQTEQINSFNYLGNETSYQNDPDIDNKLSKFQYICALLTEPQEIELGNRIEIL